MDNFLTGVDKERQGGGVGGSHEGVYLREIQQVIKTFFFFFFFFQLFYLWWAIQIYWSLVVAGYVK